MWKEDKKQNAAKAQAFISLLPECSQDGSSFHKPTDHALSKILYPNCEPQEVLKVLLPGIFFKTRRKVTNIVSLVKKATFLRTSFDLSRLCCDFFFEGGRPHFSIMYYSLQHINLKILS